MTTCPKCAATASPDSPEGNEAWKRHVPMRHPAIDEKGNLIKYPKDHPMYRPNEGDKDRE